MPDAAEEGDTNGSKSTSGSEDVNAAIENEVSAGADADSAGSLLYVGGFGSHHTGGAVFAFGDGNVKFIAEAIDQTVYEQLGHRADGKLLDRRSID
jgi:prepilin-type processing-associated H-X9-DG protein